MKQEQFVARYQQEWQDLEQWLLPAVKASGDLVLRKIGPLLHAGGGDELQRHGGGAAAVDLAPQGGASLGRSDYWM